MSFKFQNNLVFEQSTSMVNDLYSLSGKLPNYEEHGIISRLRNFGNSLLEDLAAGLSKPQGKENYNVYQKTIETIARIAALLNLCQSLGYINNQTLVAWTSRLQELTRSCYDQIKMSKK